MPAASTQTTEPFESTRLGRAYRAVAGARGDRFIAAAKSTRTWVQYESALRIFSDWCADQGAVALPASSETLRAYVIDLAERDYSPSTIAAYLQAIATQHRIAGHPIDRRPLAETMRGIRRLADPPRQAQPLLAEELRQVLALLDATKPADARDGALLAIGWAAALRQVELTGLDWQRRGAGPDKGTGALRETTEGLEVVLAVSKTSQHAVVKMPIPAADMPTAGRWLSAWTALASLRPGQPVFRAIDRHGRIQDERLSSAAVAHIIRRRVRAMALAASASEEEASLRCLAYSGHSLRAGYATSAARLGVQEWRIRARTRHRSAEMVARYVRAAEGWTESGLGGLGF
ncbi:MAG: tyrosine-type recombinase/integrase [Hyphomicrobiaceae bacterium]|nr:MAG: tyrosine-type recombinase/integrase [Hyphomicrobiaceae bacterium]